MKNSCSDWELKMDTSSICDARTSRLVIGTPHLKLMHRVSPLPFHFRFKRNDTVRLQARQRLFTVFASNSNPSGRDSFQEKSNTKATDAGQDLPFLTILAGFVVFVLVCWIVGSIVMWLIGLILRLLTS